MPAALLAHVTPLPAEFHAGALTFLAAGASLAFCARIVRGGRLAAEGERGLLLNLGVYALALAPGLSFAQREHFALLLLAPALCVCVARAQKNPVSARHAILAGLLGGLALCVKPHFVWAAAPPLMFAALHARNGRLFAAPEVLAAPVFPLLYALAAVFFFPAYFAQLPALLDVYVALRTPLAHLLASPWSLATLLMLAALAVAGRREALAPRVAVPALSGAGFFAAMLLQGKGWVNHGMPGLLLVSVAACLLVTPALARAQAGREMGGWTRLRTYGLFIVLPALVFVACVLGLPAKLSGWEEHEGALEVVGRVAPQRPSVIAISEDLDVGHPLVRRLGGRWAGRAGCLWLMGYARSLLDAGPHDAAWRATMEGYVERDALAFAQDMARNAPDVVLVSRGPSRAFLMGHAHVAGAMAAYEKRATLPDGLEVWTPKPR